MSTSGVGIVRRALVSERPEERPFGDLKSVFLGTSDKKKENPDIERTESEFRRERLTGDEAKAMRGS